MNRKLSVNGYVSYDAIIQQLMPFEAKVVGVCSRCGDTAPTDDFKLCEKCNSNVAEEYALLFTDSVMEH